jgi:hypothetical protein
MFDGQLTTKFFAINARDEEEIVYTTSTIERCYFPHCTSSQCDHSALENHFKKTQKAESITHRLGWFWGNIKLIIIDKPSITIRDLLKENTVYQCLADGCEKIFSSQSGLKAHFTRIHNIREALIGKLLHASFKKKQN